MFRAAFLPFARAAFCAFGIYVDLAVTGAFEQPGTPGQVLAKVDIAAPAEAAVKRMVPVSFSFVGDDVRWKFAPDAGLEIVREHEPDPQKRKFRLYAESPVTVQLFAVSSDKGVMSEPATREIVIGNPVPPPEVDTLPDLLKAKYTPDQKDDALALAGVYRMGAKSTVDAPQLTTNEELTKVLAAAAHDVCPLPKLAAIRGVIQSEVILKQFPNKAAPLTPATRQQWRAQLQRITAALESLAK